MIGRLLRTGRALAGAALGRASDKAQQPYVRNAGPKSHKHLWKEEHQRDEPIPRVQPHQAGNDEVQPSSPPSCNHALPSDGLGEQFARLADTALTLSPPVYAGVLLQRPVLDAGADEHLVRPPVLGGVPRAARVPWLLPLEPAHSGVVADGARLGDLDVRAASVVGPAHRCEEPAIARQDAYRLGRDVAGHHLVIAVADGLSESRRSDLGATVAARCAVDVVRKRLDSGATPADLDAKEVFRTVAGTILSAAKDVGVSPGDLCAALVLAIIPTAPTGDSGSRRAWFASVADVSAWEHTGSDWCMLAGERKDDGLDRNALHSFLPHCPDDVKVEIHELPPQATITIVSDGIGDAFTDLPGAAEWFAQRWRTPPHVASFLLDVAYEAPGQLDDRTAVTVWCGTTMGSQP